MLTRGIFQVSSPQQLHYNGAFMSGWPMRPRHAEGRPILQPRITFLPIGLPALLQNISHVSCSRRTAQ